MDYLEKKGLIMFGCSHHKTPLDLREQFSLSENTIIETYHKFKNFPQIIELLILSTCNRTEFYLILENKHNNERALEILFNEVFQKDFKHIKNHFHLLEGKSALKHLFTVASGIDSQIIGENEILGQVKEAYHLSKKHAAVGPILERIFQKAFQQAKWARTYTGIGNGKVNISSVATELALRIFDNLNETRILVIGTGKIGALTLKHLKAKGAQKITVTNRTPERALSLAAEHGGQFIAFNSFSKQINCFDIILCSTNASGIIISSTTLSETLKQRHGLPLFLIDLSVPRNICYKTASLPNTYLYNIDDLAHISHQNLKARNEAVKLCTEYLLKKADTVWHSLKRFIYGSEPTEEASQAPGGM